MDDSSSTSSSQPRAEAEPDTAKKKITFPCESCDRSFSSKGGRTNHQRKCNEKNSDINRVGKSKEDNPVSANGKTDVTKEQQNTPSLPSPPVSFDQNEHNASTTINEQPIFKWGTNDGKTVIDNINIVYEKIVF